MRMGESDAKFTVDLFESIYILHIYFQQHFSLLNNKTSSQVGWQTNARNTHGCQQLLNNNMAMEEH